MLSGCGVVAGEKAKNMSPAQLTELSDNEMCFARAYLNYSMPNQISPDFTKEFNQRNIICKDGGLSIYAERTVTSNNNENTSNVENAVSDCYKKHHDGEFKTLTEAVECEHNVYAERNPSASESDNKLSNQYHKEQLKIAKKFDDGKISSEEVQKQTKNAYNKYQKTLLVLEQNEREKQAKELEKIAKQQAIVDARNAREQAKASLEYARIREENKTSNVKCRGYGFQKGTTDFANCAMRIEQQQEQQAQQQADDARYQALLQAQLAQQQRQDERERNLAIANVFKKMGEPPPAPRRISCSHSPSGMSTDCTY